MSSGPQVISLRDEATDGVVRIIVDQGFNCFSWTRPTQNGVRDLLWSRPEHAEGKARASSGGIPLLFPFPGRIPGTSFTWRGKAYALEPSDAFGNAIHGFVHTRPWRLVNATEDRCAAEFQASIDAPELLERWPSDFWLGASYRIDGEILRFELEARNTGEEDLPFGFGTHPYFRMGVLGGAAEADVIRVPVDRSWPLKEMLPTGERLPEPYGLRQGRRFGELKLDDVLEHPEPVTGDNLCIASMSGSEGRRLEIRYGAEYRFCIVFTPPHREAICIEPYTCLPGSVTRGDAGQETGLRILAPGQRWATAIEYRWVTF